MLSEERQRVLIDILLHGEITDDVDEDMSAFVKMPEVERSEYARAWYLEAWLRYIRRHKSKEAQRADYLRRKALKQATADGTWPHWKTLIEEDGPFCAICGEEVVPGAEEWDLRPTVDHIVALAVGGKHTRSNAQLAHHGCNSNKAAFPSL